MPPTLVRPQTFNSFQSPDSASPAVRLEKSNLTSWLEYFTQSSTPDWNAIYSVFEVLVKNLVFVLETIIQQLDSLLCKDIITNANILSPLKGGVSDPLPNDDS